MSTHVLSEQLVLKDRERRLLREAVLVLAGIAVLIICAKIRVPVWPSPVPITLGTFAVLSIGASYGPRLGLFTILGYLLIGAVGFDVFANSSAEANGLSYMMGGTGGYLVGYVLATLALGAFARRGWDRNVGADGIGHDDRQHPDLRPGSFVATRVRRQLGAKPCLGPVAISCWRCDEARHRRAVVSAYLEHGRRCKKRKMSTIPQTHKRRPMTGCQSDLGSEPQ